MLTVGDLPSGSVAALKRVTVAMLSDVLGRVVASCGCCAFVLGFLPGQGHADPSFSLTMEAGAVLDRPRPDEPRAKLSTGLRSVLDYQRDGLAGAAAGLGMRRGAAPRPSFGSLLRQRADGKVQVNIHLYPGVDADAFASLLYGFDLELEILDTRNHLLQAWISLSDVESLASYEEVTALRQPGYAITNVGSALTQGDSALKADQARAAYGLDGSGVTVAAISDGVESLSVAQASGDLPASQMIDVLNVGNGDEGTALLEIIHDMAPGSNLAFYGVSTSTDMLAALDALGTFGADVVVDDLTFPDQPVFEDGPIAQAVKALVDEGVSYHTAAGNHALGHYEGEFTGVNANLPNAGDILVHEFAPGDIDLDIGTLAGGSSIITLQWNDQFGLSDNDYDLLLYDATLSNLLTFSADIQNGDPGLNPRPLEFIGIANPTGSLFQAKLVILRRSGDDRRLEVNVFRAGSILDHNDPSGSAFGHQAVDGALTIGAINVQEPGMNDIAVYSARGPGRLDFPSETWRAKPDLVGVDGVDVSGAGGFPSSFFGTSAAAPHSAAVAALLLGGGVCNGQLVHDCMTDAAVDLGAGGFDDVYGHGRIDALAAADECLPATLCGDANGDCQRTASDAFIALRTGVGADNCQGCVCDVDSQNGISASDSLTILQFGVGQNVTLACGPCS